MIIIGRYLMALICLHSTVDGGNVQTTGIIIFGSDYAAYERVTAQAGDRTWGFGFDSFLSHRSHDVHSWCDALGVTYRTFANETFSTFESP